MTVDQLTLKENELYSTVMDLYKKDPIIPQSKETERKMEIIFNSYKDVHEKYADLADKDDEALKRGLFIQWYAWTEPSWLTGIGLLDNLAMTKIITIINDKILSEKENKPKYIFLEIIDNLGVPFGRAFRSNLFVRSSQKGFPLQSLTQNVA